MRHYGAYTRRRRIQCSFIQDGAKIRAMTKQMNIPFIADEVQSGMGRTGEWWCMQHYNVKPDVMAAKALQVGCNHSK